MTDPISVAVDGLLHLDDDDLRWINAVYRPIPPVTCGRCRGEGTLPARRRFNPDRWSVPVRVPCHACDGKGTV